LIPKETIENIKSAAKIEEVVGDYEITKIKEVRERFELSIPCENALYGFYKIPGARPTRLGDPGIIYSPYRFLNILL